ncbi:tail protein [Marichromatium purpuratum 984]|uniref:Tail protein n=1 Tax=Marichromatium purpuratum 984 TaxID=765910 RepID=W0E2W4_MARPU|nr:phage tail tape measure protein [Marichromatium purpuratum]AHF03441.1 tail protein [Marichromatium purpuratum 984]
MADHSLAVRILINAKDQASAVIGKIANKWTALTAAVSGFIGVRAFTTAIGDAADFESALDAIQARTGATAEEMQRLRDAAMEAGSTTTFTATEAAEGLNILGASGLAASDAIATLPSVLALARVESVDLATAAGLITDAVSIMGLSFEDSARATDVLVRAASLSNTTATQLGEALRYAGGEARSAGLSIEETAATLDVLAQSGIRGEQAGTMLRNILGQLGDPASKARQELAALGVTSGDLGEAIDGIAAAGAAGERAVRAFGIEAGPGVRALLTEGSAGIAAYANQLNAAGGAAQQAAATMGSNLNGALQALRSAWDALRISLVDPLLEPIRREVEGLAESLGRFTQSARLEQLKATLLQTFETLVAQAKAFVAAVDWEGFAQRIDTALSGAKSSLETFANSASRTTDTLLFVFQSIGTGISTLQTAFWGLAGVVGKASAFIVEGLSKIVKAQSKLTFGPFRRKLEEVSAEIASVSESLDNAADGAFENAGAALDRTAQKGESLRETMRRLFEAQRDAEKSTRELGEAQRDAAPPAELTAEQERLAAAIKTYNAALAEARAGNGEAGLSLIELGQRVVEARAELDGLGVSAGAAAEQVEASGDRTARSAGESRDEIAQLRQEYDRLIEAGDTQGADKVLRSIRRIGEEAGESAGVTEGAAARIEAAFDQLGIVSQRALDQAATNARANFETIANSANASAEDIERAFLAWAEAARTAAADSDEARQREVESMLLAQATALGLRDAYLSLEGINRTTTDTTRNLSDSQRDLGNSAKDADEGIKKVVGSSNDLNIAFLNSREQIRNAIADLRGYSSAAADAVEEIVSGLDRWDNKIRAIQALEASDFVGDGAVDEASARIAQLEAELEATGATADALAERVDMAFNVLRDTDAVVLAITQLKQEVIEAEIAAERLAQRGERLQAEFAGLTDALDAGSIGLSEYADKLDRLIDANQRLGEEELEPLRAALDDARRKMADFTEDAQAGLRDLQAEWAELNGQQLEALLLEQEAQRLEIEMALAEAKRDGNTEAIRALEDQLDMLEQIQAVERERAAEAEAQAAIEAAEAEAEEAARRAALSDADRAHEDSIATLEARLLEAVRAQDQALEDALAAQIAAERQRHEETLANLEAESAARASTGTASTAGTTSGATGSTSTASASRAIDVRVSVNGQSSRTITVADEASADALESILSSLESAAAVAI